MPITKRTSYSQEQELPRSAGATYTRPWQRGSYSSTTGKGSGEQGGGRDAQIPRAGRHTVGNNTKSGSRPGRW